MADMMERLLTELQRKKVAPGEKKKKERLDRQRKEALLGSRTHTVPPTECSSCFLFLSELFGPMAVNSVQEERRMKQMLVGENEVKGTCLKPSRHAP